MFYAVSYQHSFFFFTVYDVPFHIVVHPTTATSPSVVGVVANVLGAPPLSVPMSRLGFRAGCHIIPLQEAGDILGGRSLVLIGTIAFKSIDNIRMTSCLERGRTAARAVPAGGQLVCVVTFEGETEIALVPWPVVTVGTCELLSAISFVCLPLVADGD